MAKTNTILQVFIASPADVNDERILLDDVILEFNKTWGNHNNVMLELLKWETDTFPAMGDDAQDVVNSQIGDDYDIFLGIMWGRFGSPTNRAESGTQEEFLRAHDRFIKDKNSIQVMFYFKNAGIPPSSIVPDQLNKVLSFKNDISSTKGVYYREFETSEEFQTSVRMHLSSVVQKWLQLNQNENSNTYVPKISTIDETDNPLANLLALENEVDEKGIFDLIEVSNESLEIVVDVLNRMEDATRILGDQMHQATSETKKATPGDLKSMKRISNKVADGLEIYVQRMSSEIVEYKKYNSRAMEGFEKIAMISKSDFNESPEDIAETQNVMQEFSNALISSQDSLSKFRDVIFKLPRMTTSFNRAKKRAVAILDDLLNQMKITENQSKDIEGLLERF